MGIDAMLVLLVISGILSEPNRWWYTDPALTTITLSEEGQVMASANSTRSHLNCNQHRQSRKKSQQQWVDEVTLLHSGYYDYSLVDYQGYNKRVCIICPVHGEFEQRAGSHSSGKGCSQCQATSNGLALRMSQEEWLSRAIQQHNGYYDYSLVNYQGSNADVQIICPVHGEFSQNARGHLRGKGCMPCSYRQSKFDKDRPKKLMKRFSEIYGDLYQYDLATMVSFSRKVRFLCNEHGWQTKSICNHLKGQGCPVCGRDQSDNKRRTAFADFATKATKKHSGRYLYPVQRFYGNAVKVVILCKKHGFFQQSPNNHLSRGHGCPKCSLPKGEAAIMEVLEKNGVPYKHQERFPWCRHKLPLVFDFHIKGTRLLIEYDGPQHSQEFWIHSSSGGGIEGQRLRDQIKNESCAREGWDLVRIPHTKFYRIKDILRTALRRHGFFM